MSEKKSTNTGLEISREEYTRETVVLWKITWQVFSYVMFGIRFNRIFIGYHDVILEPANEFSDILMVVF